MGVRVDVGKVGVLLVRVGLAWGQGGLARSVEILGVVATAGINCAYTPIDMHTYRCGGNRRD